MGSERAELLHPRGTTGHQPVKGEDVVHTRLKQLAQTWHNEAAQYRRRGQDAQAALIDSLARELEERLKSASEEVLTLRRASEISGYTPDHLARLIREGKIPNAGRPNAPRIAEGDLPRKPRASGRPASSREQIVRSVIERDRR